MARTSPLAAAAAALTLMLAAGASQAATNATVVIQTGPGHPQAAVHVARHMPPPPPPRYERVPSPRRGMVWSQGHWEWRGHRYAWVPGRWVQARHGAHYRQPRWEQRGGRWHFASGGWDHRPPPQRPGHRPNQRPGKPHRGH
ncbi:YXWGXW repeat-containing protein [Melaminivora alkalimesophila]|uniref:YXWGXW repeat-containing protein n=1 Tax=Melaminivora alkalimesophila TaxID=1165852 RepID=A0A317R9L6_9BURK|nr:YXWGXW repeat-containing protein [Melaminivora alkalimesophila]PWW44363.1 YXWGXW repeat-containing protein [Melaminivora alkalimesophila]